MWQGGDALDTRPTGHKLALELEERLRYLCLHFGPHAWEAQEDAVEIAADIDIQVTEGAEETASLELVE